MAPDSRLSHADSETSSLATLLAQMAEAREVISITDSEFALMTGPRREVTVQLRITGDDGAPAVFLGHRVQWNNARGPYKGGIRLQAGESLDSIRALAAVMSLKTALMDLPLGGAKGCIAGDPRELSGEETQQLCRAYVRELAGVLGPDLDIPAPDMYTGPASMGWMMDEYEQVRQVHAPGIITGKPLNLGGSPGRLEATAFGGLVVLREIAERHSLRATDLSIAIHGYGNAGSNFHRLAGQMLGCKVIAVCDSKSGVIRPEGLEFQETSSFKMKKGSFRDFPAGDPVSPDGLLGLDADVLAVASSDGVIHTGNQGRVTAGIVAELANCPVSASADRSLLERGVTVIPDLLCNAGGVTASFYEQVQNRQMQSWDAEETLRKLDGAMTRAANDVLAKSEKTATALRIAAQALAMERIAEAMRSRGWT